jgi:putative addiction module component (TIGR02574 family)
MATTSTTVEELAAQAIRLSPEDRSRLANLLMASLPDDGAAEHEATWDADIRRRVDEVNEGTALLVTSEEVHAAARKIDER